MNYIWSKEKFVESMTLWPTVEDGHNYFHIFRGTTRRFYSGINGLEEFGGL